MSTSFRPKQSRACVMIAARDTKTIHCYIKGCGSNVKGFTIAALDTKQFTAILKVVDLMLRVFLQKLLQMKQLLCIKYYVLG